MLTSYRFPLGEWRNGRRAGLKNWLPCGFDSHLPYQAVSLGTTATVLRVGRDPGLLGTQVRRLVDLAETTGRKDDGLGLEDVDLATRELEADFDAANELYKLLRSL